MALEAHTVLATLTSRYTPLDCDAFRQGQPTEFTVDSHEWTGLYLHTKNEFHFERVTHGDARKLVVIEAPKRLFKTRLTGPCMDITFLDSYDTQPELVQRIEDWLEERDILVRV